MNKLVVWMSGTILQFDPNLVSLMDLKINEKLLNKLSKQYSQIIFIVKYKDGEELELIKYVMKSKGLDSYQFLFIPYDFDTTNLYENLLNKIGEYDYLDSSRPRITQAGFTLGKEHTYHISQFIN